MIHPGIRVLLDPLAVSSLAPVHDRVHGAGRVLQEQRFGLGRLRLRAGFGSEGNGGKWMTMMTMTKSLEVNSACGW